MYFASFQVRSIRSAARYGCVLASYPPALDLPYLDFVLPSSVGGGTPYIAASFLVDALPNGSQPDDVYTFVVCEDLDDVAAYWHTLHYLIYAGQILGPSQGSVRYWYGEDAWLDCSRFAYQLEV